MSPSGRSFEFLGAALTCLAPSLYVFINQWDGWGLTNERVQLREIRDSPPARSFILISCALSS